MRTAAVGTILVLALACAGAGWAEEPGVGVPTLAGTRLVALPVNRPVVARWGKQTGPAHLLLPGRVLMGLPEGPLDEPRTLLVEGGTSPVVLDLAPRKLAHDLLEALGPEAPRVLEILEARRRQGGDLVAAVKDLEEQAQAAEAVVNWPALRGMLAGPDLARIFQFHQQVLIARELAAPAEDPRSRLPAAPRTPGPVVPPRVLGTAFEGRPRARFFTHRHELLERGDAEIPEASEKSYGLLRSASATRVTTLVDLGFEANLHARPTLEFPWPDEIPPGAGVGFLTLKLQAVASSQLLALKHSRGVLYLWLPPASFAVERRPTGRYSVGFPLEAGPRPGERVVLTLRDLGGASSDVVKVTGALVHWRRIGARLGAPRRSRARD